jgi:hypothetical protein
MKRALAVVFAALAVLVVGTVAMGGVEELITGAEIKDGSIGSNDIKPGSLQSRHIQDRTITNVDLSKLLLRSLRGATGQTGPQGPKGDQGAQGAPGKSLTFISAYSEQTSVPPGSFRFANAICPTGTFVVAGGYATDDVSNAALTPTNSYPVAMGDGRPAWYVAMRNLGATDQIFRVWANCAQMS